MGLSSRATSASTTTRANRGSIRVGFKAIMSGRHGLERGQLLRFFFSFSFIFLILPYAASYGLTLAFQFCAIGQVTYFLLRLPLPDLIRPRSSRSAPSASSLLWHHDFLIRTIDQSHYLIPFGKLVTYSPLPILLPFNLTVLDAP